MALVAGGLAHDLNNHITIIGHAAEMAEIVNQPERHLQAWRQVLGLCARARATIDRIHAFSREASGRQQRLDLAEITAESIRLVRASLPSKITLASGGDVEAGVCAILANANQVQESLIHLVYAAVAEFPEKGGLIEIGLYCAKAGERDGADSKADDRYVCGWRFSAKGMARVPALWRDLGAAAVSSSVDAHDEDAGSRDRMRGLLTAHGVRASLAADGLMIGIEWPRCPPSVERVREATSAGHERELVGWHVAVVEDEADELDLLRDVLQARGARVSAFGAAEDFLRWLRGGPAPDLLVVDQVLDEHSGELLAERLHAVSPDTPVLLIGGRLQAGSPAWVQGRPLRTLPKPFAFAEFFAALETLSVRKS